ncbi:hypothetical protein HY041_01870 [Candidatus Roizmanbacteria bacterium]|nr:hypothetical protein [Candidatus Roizmanbacteria bacterium]
MGKLAELYFHTRDWEMKVYKKLHIGKLLKLYLQSPQFRIERSKFAYKPTGDFLQAPTLRQLLIFYKKSKENEVFHLISGTVISSIAVGFLFLAQNDTNANILPILSSGATGLYAFCIDLPAILFQRYTRGRIQKIIKK